MIISLSLGVVLLGIVVLITLTLMSQSIEGRITRTVPFRGCTMDIPSSSCGPYEVTFQPASGEVITYYAPGWDGRDEAERSEQIAKKIEKAKEQKSVVRITVDKDGVITSITE